MARYKDARDAATVSDGGTVSGYASTFDRDPDAYGDVIAQGAFEKSLQRWHEIGKPVPLLYGHNVEDPEYNIGEITHIAEDEKGLYVEGRFDPDNPKAQYVRKLVQQGRLYQFSFAYDCTDWHEIELDDGRKANELRELDVFEVSLVQIPANQHAIVTDVKDAPPAVKAGRRNSKADESELRSIAEHASAIQTIVNGLLQQADEADTENDEQANADEPKQHEAQANADEPSVKYRELLDEAMQFIGKEDQQ